MNVLTKVRIEKDVEFGACKPEGGEKSPNFRHWKFEDTRQMEDDPGGR